MSSNVRGHAADGHGRPLTSHVRSVGYPRALAGQETPGTWPTDAPRRRPSVLKIPQSNVRHWSGYMRILVLGGDGYLGWPTALHLNALGHDVAVNDNFARHR